MRTDRVIADLVDRAMRSRLAGKTVADRVKLITGTQKTQVRSILLKSIKAGEEPAAIVAKVQKFYRGVDGAGGPAYMARRRPAMRELGICTICFHNQAIGNGDERCGACADQQDEHKASLRMAS